MAFKLNLANLQDTVQKPQEYGRFQQHCYLLFDVRRVSLFADAIEKTKATGPVVDVGAGNGILSLLALKQGCEHAFLIEPSDKIAQYATHLMERNGMAGKFTIIDKPLEYVDMSKLPKTIDLIVSETISSLIFGFGSWDAFPKLVERVSSKEHIVPTRGKLDFILVEDDSLLRAGPHMNGFDYLKSKSIHVDLLDYTFFSSGNMFAPTFEKSLQTYLEEKKPPIATMQSFDFAKPDPYPSRVANSIPVEDGKVYTGIVGWFTVDLSYDGKTVMSAIDPTLFAWKPYHIPLKTPIKGSELKEITLELLLKPEDAPYTYAFQFIDHTTGKELTHTLYW